LLAKAASTPVTPGAIVPGDDDPGTEYLAHFAIGTPPQPVQLTLDTGSDLVWTQCRPCKVCFKQALPYFDPSLSSTLAGVPCGSTACQSLPEPSCARSTRGQQACGYTYSYGDNSVTIGRIETDTVTFEDGHAAAASSVTGVSFGCGHNNSGIFTSNETGIAGFGRGFLSLPSQLKVGNFSHCFTTIRSAAPSAVLLGLPANLYNSARGVVQTTRLVRNSRSPNTYYYLSLRGITVGSTRLPVPKSAFALRDDGDGGTIIDSGTSLTSLPEDVYKLLREAFVAQVRLPVHHSPSLSELCFVAPSSSARPDVPKLLFHFEGATLDLPRGNYMFEIEEAGRSATCLAINNAGPGSTTIIGNYQQQNMHVLYDLTDDKLSFVPAHCEKL
jgi:hypothetical protein